MEYVLISIFVVAGLLFYAIKEQKVKQKSADLAAGLMIKAAQERSNEFKQGAAIYYREKDNILVVKSGKLVQMRRGSEAIKILDGIVSEESRLTILGYIKIGEL